MHPNPMGWPPILSAPPDLSRSSSPLSVTGASSLGAATTGGLEAAMEMGEKRWTPNTGTLTDTYMGSSKAPSSSSSASSLLPSSSSSSFSSTVASTTAPPSSSSSSRPSPYVAASSSLSSAPLTGNPASTIPASTSPASTEALIKAYQDRRMLI